MGPEAGEEPPAGRKESARGRPRSETARKAVLAAAAELLLARGLSAVSMDAVAERAGVSKATIYRWWPSKESLALDALYAQWAAAGALLTTDEGGAAESSAAEDRGTGSLRAELLALLLPWARLAGSGPYGRVIAALLTEAQTDPVFAAEYQRRLIGPRRERARQILLRAAARGDVPAGQDTDVVIDLLYGPLYHRLLHGHAPLDDQFVADVVDMVLAGVLPRHPPL
jgi:AcrR family transcriptional regulator